MSCSIKSTVAPECPFNKVFNLNNIITNATSSENGLPIPQAGHSGATVDLIEQLIFYINNRIIPVIPQQGSLGASGDLAPLSHLALALIGEGLESH